MFTKKAIRAPGHAKREKTRDEEIAEARAARAARGEDRARGKAATTIKAVWRGWRCRKGVREGVQQQLLAQVTPLVVAAGNTPLDAAWVAGWLVPRLLLLVRVPPTSTQPVQLAGDAQLLKCVRACLAVLVRSLTSPDGQQSYQGLGLRQAHTNEGAACWCTQACRLVRLCAAVVCAPIQPATTTSTPQKQQPPLPTATTGSPSDTLLDAAASRLIVLMCDPGLWKCEGEAATKQLLAQRLCVKVAAQPAPLLAAVLRVLGMPVAAAQATLAVSVGCSPAKAAPGAAPAATPAAAATPVSPVAAAGAGGGAAAAAGTAALAPKLLAVTVRMLQAATPRNDAAAAAAGGGAGGSAAAPTVPVWRWFACLIMPAPTALGALTTETKAQLCEHHMLVTLCEALRQATQPTASTELTPPSPDNKHMSGTNESSSPSRQLPPPLHKLLQLQGDCALWAAANLTLLMFNAPAATINNQGSSAVVAKPAGLLLHGLGHLHNAPFLALLYCQSVSVLLCKASGFLQQPACAPHQLALCAAACTHGLWPLAQRPVILELAGLLVSSQDTAAAGLPMLCALWSEACEVLQLLTKQLAAAGQQQLAAGLPSLLSSLAFTPGLLPRMWVWLGQQVGLPLEAPKEASRGLSVVSLRQGYKSLAPHHALVLGLFCRLYHHLLQVIYDDEFHAARPAVGAGSDMGGGGSSAQGGSLTLTQSRAVVTSLNTLIYHTYLPLKNTQPTVTTARSSGTGSIDVWRLVSFPPDSLLSTYAPLLLRSLYERDTRRPYCQPALWVAPYQEMFGDVDAAVAAHNTALLRAGDDAAEAAWAHARSNRTTRRRSSSSGSETEAPATPGQGGSSRRERSGTSGFFSNLFSSSRNRGGGSGSAGGAHAAGGSAAAAVPVAPSTSVVPVAVSAAAVSAQQEVDRVMAGFMSWVTGSPEEGVQPATPADPRAALVGPFRASRVVACFLAGGEERGGEGEQGEGDEVLQGAPGLPALKVRAAEGARPESLASLLRTAPQAIPFDRRVDLFRALLAEDKARGAFDRPVFEGGAAPVKVTIRRSHFMEDAYRALAGQGRGLRARLVITFINQQGLSEAGLDYGGLMKEFLEEVVVRGFNADAGLWATSPDTGQVYPRPSADRMESGTQMLQFLGLMVGKALYEGILLNVSFAPFFVARLQGRTPLLDDLHTLDPELHKSLMQVKAYEGDVSDLGLTFSVDDDFFGSTTQHALLPGQANTPVTNENRLLYCHLLADWHLNVRLGRAAEAFSRGLACCIPPASLRLFSPQEFNQLISGGGDEGGALDVNDMRRHARYSGGYRPDSTSVKLLWQVLAEFSPEQRGKLLRFCTSCSRAPLGGFRYLQPPLTIHKVDCDASVLALVGGRDVDRLPSASTCYNTLKLPNYRRKETLRTKLLYAINSGAGFELS